MHFICTRSGKASNHVNSGADPSASANSTTFVSGNELYLS